MTVTESREPAATDATRGRFTIGVDWWATIVAGVFVVLAVANVLPKIPW